MKGRLVREGRDVCVLAAGKMFAAAETACEILAEEGIDATLWDPRVVKPLDREMVRHAADHPFVVTVEDGVRVGGFGSQVTDALQRRPAGPFPRVLQLGTPDEFLPHGEAAGLHEELGLDAHGIAASVRKALLRDAD